MCVDKTPEELDSFDALLEESRQFGRSWDIVFVAALFGRGASSPTSEQAQEPCGDLSSRSSQATSIGFVPFDARSAGPLRLSNQQSVIGSPDGSTTPKVSDGWRI